MNSVISLIFKAFNSDLSTKKLELKDDREYVIHFAMSLKKARKDIQVTDYSVSREEQLTSKSSRLAKVIR